jgi:hypothetical protein
VAVDVEALKESIHRKRGTGGPGGARPGAGRPRKPDTTDPDLVLPPVGKTEKAIREYLAAVAEAAGMGRLDLKRADTCISAAKASLVALKQGNAKSEIRRLQQMLKQAQMLARRGAQQEQADRLGQVAGAVDDEDADDEESDDDED